MRRPVPSLAALLPLPLVLLAVACSGPRPPAAPNVGADGLALAGHDPTTYFEGRPRTGSERHTLTHDGATYRFVDGAHRARFASDPARFAPAYGGWCAWAMADDELVEVDPESYLIQDDRLLLFYDGAFGDTRARWLAADPDALLEAADRHWAQRLARAGEG